MTRGKAAFGIVAAIFAAFLGFVLLLVFFLTVLAGNDDPEESSCGITTSDIQAGDKKGGTSVNVPEEYREPIK